MKTTSLGELNLYDFGSSIQISGTIFSGNNRNFAVTVPEKDVDYSNLELLPLTLEEWEKLLKQLDLLETEIFAQDSTGITKTLVRKSQRQIDNYLQWTCYKRDNYTCQYCGRDGVPLTVDHILIWEEGGPTIQDNLLTACRSCNKDRGRMNYTDWLKSDVYQQKSKNLPEDIKNKNLAKALDLPRLETLKVKNIRSR